MNDSSDAPKVSRDDKLRSLYRVATFRPKLAAGILSLSILAAFLEGIGLSFLVPIIEIVQGGGTSNLSRTGEAFVRAYEFAGVPFTLETAIVGVSIVMVVRYLSSFVVSWLESILLVSYIRHLQSVGFRGALDVRVGYYDEHGTDEVLNALVTQVEWASRTIRGSVKLLEQGFLMLMYLAVALYIAPVLTLITGVFLGGGVFVIRWVMESGYSIGDRVAEANERVQEVVQAGTQGVRDVKLFGLGDELYDQFNDSVEQFANSKVKLDRNQAMMSNVYQAVTGVMVFVLIYVAIRFASLTLASLGLFLFTMFRLAPRVSTLNNIVYGLEGNLPHLVRTQKFIDTLAKQEEVDSGTRSPPDPVESVAFEGVKFSYQDEQVLDRISFSFDRKEFISFVGPSGAGKSTIVSLIARLYEPGVGEITADGTPVSAFDIGEWRDRLSVVRQDPYLFNESVRDNVTIGNRDASESEIRRVCEIAQVTEFLDDLPQGLDTVLGDEGVRLSGGQRQRVALARSLLRDADVLVLDEATSDLDSNIEERVHQAVQNMDRDYAVLIIAHRLSTVVNSDRIYVMEDGEITEVGRHETLLEEGGLYADLYATQTQDK